MSTWQRISFTVNMDPLEGVMLEGELVGMTIYLVDKRLNKVYTRDESSGDPILVGRWVDGAVAFDGGAPPVPSSTSASSAASAAPSSSSAERATPTRSQKQLHKALRRAVERREAGNVHELLQLLARRMSADDDGGGSGGGGGGPGDGDPIAAAVGEAHGSTRTINVADALVRPLALLVASGRIRAAIDTLAHFAGRCTFTPAVLPAIMGVAAQVGRGHDGLAEEKSWAQPAGCAAGSVAANKAEYEDERDAGTRVGGAPTSSDWGGGGGGGGGDGYYDDETGRGGAGGGGAGGLGGGFQGLDADALCDLVDRLVACTTFPDGDLCRAYFASRAKWACREFAAEATNALYSFENQTPDELVRAGKAFVGAAVLQEPGDVGGHTVRCVQRRQHGEHDDGGVGGVGGVGGGGMARRVFAPGDAVMLSVEGGNGGDGNDSAEWCCWEGEVLSRVLAADGSIESMMLRMGSAAVAETVCQKGSGAETEAASTLSARRGDKKKKKKNMRRKGGEGKNSGGDTGAISGSGVGTKGAEGHNSNSSNSSTQHREAGIRSPLSWRVDKLGNRVNFNRFLRALRVITAPPESTNAEGLTSQHPPRPNSDIVGALVRCVADSDTGGGDGGGEGGGGGNDGDGDMDTDSYYGGGTSTIDQDRHPHPDVVRYCGTPVETSGRKNLDAAAIGMEGADAGLNKSQQRSIAAAMRQRVTLIQGPPGTGKTKVAVCIALKWLASSATAPPSTTSGVGGGASSSAARGGAASGRTSVLVCADSNVAVDNLVEGLANAGLRVVRVGQPELARSDLLQYSLEGIATRAAAVEQSRKQGQMPAWMVSGGKGQKEGTPRKSAVQAEATRLVRDADVVVSTCLGAGSAVLQKHRFTRVLVDEASQATELATAVPLCLGCQQLVLIGDHRQLPPTVMCEEQADRARTGHCDGLGMSLFERLVRHGGVQPELLNRQYRMHPSISQFPSRTFYDGAIRDGRKGEGKAACPASCFPWPQSPQSWPVCFVNMVGGKGEVTDGSSKYNDAEADLVFLAIRSLLRPPSASSPSGSASSSSASSSSFSSSATTATTSTSFLAPLEIGVVTPYQAQVRRIRKRLGSRFRDVEVSSVDGYQGREKRVIIISTVRSNHGGNLGFVEDVCRANVALTRAKDGLIVVGDGSTLQGEPNSWGI